MADGEPDFKVDVVASGDDAFRLAREVTLKRAELLSVDSKERTLRAKLLTTGASPVRLDLEVTVHEVDQASSRISFYIAPFTGSSLRQKTAEIARDQFLGYLTSLSFIVKDGTTTVLPRSSSSTDGKPAASKTSGGIYGTLGILVFGILAVIIGGVIKHHIELEAALCNSGLGQLSGAAGTSQCLGSTGLYDVGQVLWDFGWFVSVGSAILLVVLILALMAASASRASASPVRQVTPVPQSGDESVASWDGQVPRDLDSARSSANQAAPRGESPEATGSPTVTPVSVQEPRKEQRVKAQAGLGDDVAATGLQADMTCPGCQSGVSVQDRFCPSCGERLYFPQNPSGGSVADLEDTSGGKTIRKISQRDSVNSDLPKPPATSIDE